MPLRCPICGANLQSLQALRWHMLLKKDGAHDDIQTIEDADRLIFSAEAFLPETTEEGEEAKEEAKEEKSILDTLRGD